jgi:CubicO group peptidase (beta-lactamase class C family)
VTRFASIDTAGAERGLRHVLSARATSVAATATGALLTIAMGAAAVSANYEPTRARAPSAFDSLFAELRRDSTHDIKGVLVVRDGRPIAEAYFNGDDTTTLHDIRSATKSITSLLVGIAIDRGLVAGVDAPLSSLLSFPKSGVGAVTLRDVLTMRSGLDSDDQDSLATGNEDRLDRSNDWLSFASRVPVIRPPGGRYIYSSLNAYLAGAVVERVAKEPLSRFAEQFLFDPLGIHRYRWRRGPRGEGVGQGNLSITLRDLAKFGALVLQGGEYGGRRVVSSHWIHDALEPIVPIASVDPYADAYGYLWYSKQYAIGTDTVLVHFASGNGGNKIYVVPQEHLVVAVTSGAYGTRYGQRRSEGILLRVLAVSRG